MLPAKLSSELSQIRLDIEGSNQAKLRLGVALTVVIVAVIATGWPHEHMVQRVLFYVLAVLPASGIAVGLVAQELIHARADRRGEEQADEREFLALRAMIAADDVVQSRRMAVSGARTATHEPTPAPTAPQKPRRSASPPRRRLVARSRGYAPFRTGFLGLR